MPIVSYLSSKMYFLFLQFFYDLNITTYTIHYQLSRWNIGASVNTVIYIHLRQPWMSFDGFPLLQGWQWQVTIDIYGCDFCGVNGSNGWSHSGVRSVNPLTSMDVTSVEESSDSSNNSLHKQWFMC